MYIYLYIYISLYYTPNSTQRVPLSSIHPSRHRSSLPSPTLLTYHEESRDLRMTLLGRMNQSGPAIIMLRVEVGPFLLGDRRTQPWRGRRQTGARGTRRRRTGREETAIGMKRDEYKRIRHIYIYTYIYIYI